MGNAEQRHLDDLRYMLEDVDGDILDVQTELNYKDNLSEKERDDLNGELRNLLDRQEILEEEIREQEEIAEYERTKKIIGTDAYRHHWEQMGQRRLPC